MPDTLKYPQYGGILKIDTFANLPTDSVDGTPAVILDTDILYIWDETTLTWIATGSSSGLVEATINATVATTAALSGSPTYSNGAGGVGATLTRTGNGAIGTIDGISIVVSDRILVKNQSNQLENGLYLVTDAGSAGTPYVLTRTNDSDETAEFDDQVVGIAQGTANAGTLWGQQTNTPTVGTDDIVYAVSTLGGVKQQTSGSQILGQIPWWVTANKTLSKGNQDLTWIDSTKTFTIKNSGNQTFLVDPTNQSYGLGDLGGAGNNLSLVVNDFNRFIRIQDAAQDSSFTISTSVIPNNAILKLRGFEVFRAQAGTTLGTVIDVGIGDVGNANNGTYTFLDDANETFSLYFANDQRIIWDPPSASLRPHGSSAGNTYELRFHELLTNGGNYAGYKAPDARTSNTNLIMVLPPDDPTAGQVMAFSAPSASVSTGSWITPLSSGAAWLLDGNTNGSEKYLGTDDNFRLPFRVNNVETFSLETNGSITRYGIVWSRETAGAGAELTTWGYNAGASVASSSSQSVMVGYGAGANLIGGNGFTAVGTSALILATVASNTAVGGGSGILHTTGNDCAYLGFRSGEDNVTGDFVTAIGSHAYSGGSGFSSILSLSSDGGTANNQIIIGGARNYNTTGESSFTDMYIGRGVTHATPGAITIHATSGLGTDVAGANLNFAIGQGTGTGNPGDYIFYKSPPAGSSGSSLNALSETFRISGTSGAITRDSALYSVAAATTTTTWGNLAGAASNGLNTSSIYIGYGAGIASTASSTIVLSGDTNNFGFAATYGNSTIAIGSGTLVSSTAGFNVGIGGGAGQFNTTGTGNVYLGYNADFSPTFGNATGSNNFVFGQYGFVGGSFECVFSAQGLPTASNQIVFGGGNAAAFYSAGYFGNGVVNSTPQDFVFNGTGGSGTDKDGANVTIAGGKGTGSGAPGTFIIQTPTVGTTGSTLQSLATRSIYDQTNVSLQPHGTSAGNTYEVRFLELAANGTNYTAFKAADALAQTTTYIWPSTDPTAGQYLSSSAPSGGVCTLSWGTPAGGGGGPTFLDNVFRIQDDGDATKQLAWEVSGIATATTRTITALNISGTDVLSNGALTATRVPFWSASGLVDDAGFTFASSTLTAPIFVISTRAEPASNDGAPLGTTTKQFSDLFLAEGGVINWDNGDATLTQVGDVVTLAGADLKITTPGTAATSVATIDGTQTLTNKTIGVTQLNGGAYTMAVNNTNATANYTAVNHTYPGKQTYAGTATWTAGTAPSGATNHSYVWSQFNKTVTLNITLIYAVAGSTCTVVSMTLPTDCPAPLEMDGLGAASTKLYPGAGYHDSALGGNPGASRSWMRVNAADTGFECVIIAASQSSIMASFTIDYFAA